MQSYRVNLSFRARGVAFHAGETIEVTDDDAEILAVFVARNYLTPTANPTVTLAEAGGREEQATGAGVDGPDPGGDGGPGLTPAAAEPRGTYRHDVGTTKLEPDPMFSTSED